MIDLTTRLTKYAKEIECKVRLVPLDEWPNTPTHTYGWLDPIAEGDDVVLTFCPERMGDSLQILDDEGVESYLDMVEFIISGIVMDLDLPEEDCPDRDTVVAKRVALLRTKRESDLWDLKAEAMEALGVIQMLILDESLAS